MTNKELIERYPFISYDEANDFEQCNYTILDDMPVGWKIAFGEEMCEEIRQALIEENKKEEYTEENLKELADWCLDEPNKYPMDLLHLWKIEQLKEKYGSMRLYPNFQTDKIKNIIRKYEIQSMYTCCECGKPAAWMSTGWFCPYCDDCKPAGSMPIKDNTFGG